MSRSERPPLNIPSGNSPISPDPSPDNVRPDERRTGDTVKDIKTAVSRIDVVHDFENIGSIPCARTSLLYGIAGGSGVGAVRYLGSRRPGVAANWAMAGFMVISIMQWELCTRARAKELQQMRLIQERFPHRHISNLKKRGDDGPPGSPPDPSNTTVTSNPS